MTSGLQRVRVQLGKRADNGTKDRPASDLLLPDALLLVSAFDETTDQFGRQWRLRGMLLMPKHPNCCGLFPSHHSKDDQV